MKNQSGKRDEFDVDQMITIESKFSSYKSKVYDIALSVEKFWFYLSNKDCDINELLNIGIKIVENYMEVHILQEKLFELKPDFMELVKLNINFYQSVMQFESEGY